MQYLRHKCNAKLRIMIILSILICIGINVFSKENKIFSVKGGKHYSFTPRIFQSSLFLKIYVEKNPGDQWKCIGVVPSNKPILIPSCNLWLVEPIGKFNIENDWKKLVYEIKKNKIPGLITPEGIEDRHLKNLSVLTNLQVLFVRDCNNFTEKGLSYLSALSGLKRLYYLSTNHINNYMSLHFYLSEQIRLYFQTKDFTGISYSIVKYISNLKKLEVLNLSICKINDNDLKELLKLQKLKELTIYNKENITNKGLKYISKFKELVSLSISCNKLTGHCLQNLSDLKNLQKLHLYWCKNFTDYQFESICNLVNLKELLIQDYKRLTENGFTKITNLIKLEKLVIFDPHEFDANSFSYLCEIKNLNEFVYQYFFRNRLEISSTGLKNIANCNKLKKLWLESNYNSSNSSNYLKYLTNNNKLESLSLTNFTFNKEDLQFIPRLVNLKELKLVNIMWSGDNNKYFKNIWKLSQLESLFIENSFGNMTTECLDGIEKLKQLRELSLFSFSNMSEKMKVLSGFEKLERLYMEFSDYILKEENLKYIEKLKKLKELSLINSGGIGSIGLKNIAKIQNLKSLNLSVSDNKLKAIVLLKNLTSLKTGYIQSKDFQYIARLKKLQELSIGIDKDYFNYQGNDWLYLQNLNFINKIYLDAQRDILYSTKIKDLKRMRDRYLPCCRLRPKIFFQNNSSLFRNSIYIFVIILISLLIFILVNYILQQRK